MKTKLTLSIILIGFFSVCEKGRAQAPSWNWAVIPDSMDVNAVTSDNAGNIYVAGSYNRYLTKYDAAANLIWTKTNYSCGASAVCTDNAGNIYITGSFNASSSNPMYFDTIPLWSLNSNYDLFTLKLDSSGNVKWAKRAGGSSSDGSVGISTDGAGNVYVIGAAAYNFIFGNDTLISTASVPSFSFLKYDMNGNEVWGKIIGGNSGGGTLPASKDICTDVNGNSYITGYFGNNSIDFGGITLPNTSGGSQDYFIAKYDSAGNLKWAKGATGAIGKYGKSITLDQFGNPYVTGEINGTSVFDTISLTSPGRCFIIKYDTSGIPIWAKGFGSWYGDIVTSISIDSSRSTFITGKFYNNTLNFGNCTLHNMDPTVNTSDVFIVKYDSLSNELWAKSAGSDTNDNAFSIHVDANSNAYVVGNFWTQQMLFDGIVINDTNPCNPWCINSFIARLDHCSSYYALYPDTIPHNWIAVNQASGIAPVTYMWDWGDGTFSSGATPSHIYNTPGYYNICLTITDATGCTNTYCDSSTYLYKGNSNSPVTINVVMSLPSGIDDIEGNSGVNLYPNPVNDVLYVSLKKPSTLNTLMSITDMQGRVVKEEKILNNNGSVIPIDVSALSQGVYLLRMDGVVKRFVKL